MDKNLKRAGKLPDKKAPGPVFGRSLLCALALSLLYAVPHGGLHPPSAAAGLFLWSDALALSGVLILLLAGMFRLDRGGIWDGVWYVLYQARFLLRGEKDESYTNYSDFKHLREHSTAPLWPWLLTGLVWLGASLLMGAYTVRS